MQRQGVGFAAIKVHEDTYISRGWIDNYHAALDAGIPLVILYSFARPDLESGAQAAAILLDQLSLAGGLAPGTTLALDLEEHGGATPEVGATADLAAYALDWYAHAAYPTGLTPFLYSRVNYMAAHNLLSPDLSTRFRLWLVTWDGLDHSIAPAHWPRIDLAQTGQGILDGIDGSVDLDRFTGRAYDLTRGAWGYLPTSLPTTPIPADVDGDVPTILAHVSSLVATVGADLALARTKFGLVGG